jgi:hypothetical protein
MKFLSTTLLTLTTLLSGTAFSATKPVSVKCTFSEFHKAEQTQNVENPFGGGKVVSFKYEDGSVLSAIVMLETNEDNHNLIDMTLLITDASQAQLNVGARGISENKYKENGVSVIVKNAALKCGI